MGLIFSFGYRLTLMIVQSYFDFVIEKKMNYLQDKAYLIITTGDITKLKIYNRLHPDCRHFVLGYHGGDLLLNVYRIDL